MRAYTPAYEVLNPQNLQEALEFLNNGVCKPLAGGTDLMVLFEAGKLPEATYLNLSFLSELRGISTADNFVSIGALTTYSEIRESAILQKNFNLLCLAARETGAIAIQNRGTLGGNIANASPAADSSPALLCYDAEIELTSLQGVRRVPYSKFHEAYKKTALKPNELITRILLPKSKANLQSYFKKVGTRKAQAISKVCFAGLISIDQKKTSDIRLAFGSVGPMPVRCSKTEKLLMGQVLCHDLMNLALTTLQSEISPIDDIRSVGRYRNQIAKNLLLDFLSSKMTHS